MTADLGRQASPVNADRFTVGSTPAIPRHSGGADRRGAVDVRRDLASFLGAVDLARLQRSIGNRAVLGLLQQQTRTSVAGSPSIQRDYEKDGTAGGTFESERFGVTGSKRERATYVELPVRIRTTGGRGAAPPPLSQFEHGGKVDLAGTARKPGFDGGHVVGLSIGGEDIPENVVPMFKAFNRGVYKNMEDEVKKRAGDVSNGGNQPWVTVTCYYGDEEADTPYAFDVLLESQPATGGRTPVWTTFLRQPEDIKLVAPLSDDDQKVVRGETGADEARALAGATLDNSPDMFVLGPNETASGYIKAHGVMPPTQKGWYPDAPAHRPYQHLDMLLFANKLPVSNEVSQFRDFTGHQRELILQANMARNGGQIKSDDPKDPIAGGILSEQGDLNFPEIDHIVPKSSGGSNMFSNARVVSWQLNNQDDRVKSLLGVVDMSKRALPSLRGMGAKDIPELVLAYLTRSKPSGIFSEQHVWLWGTQTFTVMNGQTMTKGRAALVKNSLLRYVKSDDLELNGGGYQIKNKT